ncbi:MAG TPA: hypothetical protein VF772_09190 [Terriglobales bacterium]
MGSSEEEWWVPNETGKNFSKEDCSSAPDEPCCQEETVCSDEGTVGGTQAAGESCVAGEPGSGRAISKHM